MNASKKTSSAGQRRGGARVSARGTRRAADVRLGVLEGWIGFHLRMAQGASFRAFAGCSGGPQLKPGRFAALLLIRYNPGITQSALGRAMARDKSSVTPLLQDLQRLGYVTRRQSEADRRNVHLTLTPDGRRALGVLIAHARNHERRLERIVGKRKLWLIGLLRNIADMEM